MKWISVKDKLPQLVDYPNEKPVLAYHTIYGVGIGRFYYLDDESLIEDALEGIPENKYLVSVSFIKNQLDGNWCPELIEDIDILEIDCYFINLGMVTHWMPFPISPQKEKE